MDEVGGLIGARLTDSVGGAFMGDLFLMSMWQGYVDYRHDIDEGNINDNIPRNSFSR